MDQKIQNVQDKIEDYKIFLKSRADPCKDYDPATLEEIEKDMREIEVFFSVFILVSKEAWFLCETIKL